MLRRGMEEGKENEEEEEEDRVTEIEKRRDILAF